MALIVLIVTLFSSSFSNFAYAAYDYDHEALMDYKGYGQSMYESIVEQTSFVTGQYTDNKVYVRDSIDEIKDYASFWASEREMLEGACGGTALFTGECLGTIAESTGGYVLTLGDIVKNFFADYKEETAPNEVLPDYQSAYQGCLYLSGLYIYPSNTNGCLVQIVTPTGIYDAYNNRRIILSNSGKITRVIIDYVGTFNTSEIYDTEIDAILAVQAITSDFNSFVAAVQTAGITFIVQKNSQTLQPSEVVQPSQKVINDYVQNNPITLPLPQLKPNLVCPDGTKIQMSISGSTFLAVDGTTMVVNEDGTAEVNSEICNLNWEKPNVKYNGEGIPVVETDQGERDLTTGEIVAGTEPPVNCDGVLCFLSELIKSVTGLVTKLLDGILGLFVPDDISFITDEFTRITDSLTAKIAITEDLKEMLTGMFIEGASNPLQEITIDLPIVGKPLQFGDMALINEGVPILKKVISAICILYTLLYVYRKITGRGGVMEK